jgi:hypothetical protein
MVYNFVFVKSPAWEQTEIDVKIKGTILFYYFLSSKKNYFRIPTNQSYFQL